MVPVLVDKTNNVIKFVYFYCFLSLLCLTTVATWTGEGLWKRGKRDTSIVETGQRHCECVASCGFSNSGIVLTCWNAANWKRYCS